MNYPHILLKTAMSLDGYIDDTSSIRRLFSGPEDAEEVSKIRAAYDAIIVGAGTVRADNPRLVISSQKLRQERELIGRSADITKVTLTCSGNLDHKLNFFTLGGGEKIVYAPKSAASYLSVDLAECATVVSAPGSAVDPCFVAQDLYERGVRRLIIEGGSSIISLFLEAGLVSEMRIAVAPCFIADSSAPKFAQREIFSRRKNLFSLKMVKQFGDISVLTYTVEQ